VLLTYSKISDGVLLCSSLVSISLKHAAAVGSQYPVANPVGAVTNLVVAHHIQQRDDVGATRQILQDLDLTLYLLLLDRLEDLDDAFLVVDHIDALKNLRVLSAANLADYLVVLKHAPGNVDGVVVPVRPGHVRVDIGVDAGEACSPAAVVQRHSGNEGVLCEIWRASTIETPRGSGSGQGVV
jgi:hypothetical protein